MQKGNSPQEDKLSLACFNSGDVPELIGRLNVTLSPANHKVITLPMFRKELGVSRSPPWSSTFLLFLTGESFCHSCSDSRCCVVQTKGATLIYDRAA